MTKTFEERLRLARLGNGHLSKEATTDQLSWKQPNRDKNIAADYLLGASTGTQPRTGRYIGKVGHGQEAPHAERRGCAPMRGLKGGNLGEYHLLGLFQGCSSELSSG
jgi:hypothetical protein